MLLPVTGDLQQSKNRLGWLCADGQPVLRTLRIDLDEGRLFLRVVDTNVLDYLAVTTGAGISNNNAVLSSADLAQTLQLNLDSHDGSFSSHWAVQTRTR